MRPDAYDLRYYLADQPRNSCTLQRNSLLNESATGLQLDVLLSALGK